MLEHVKAEKAEEKEKKVEKKLASLMEMQKQTLAHQHQKKADTADTQEAYGAAINPGHTHGTEHL